MCVRNLLPASVLVGLTGVSGCADGSGADLRQGTIVEDSAGVRLVLNGEVGAWGAAPAQLEEVLRIGVVEGPDEYQFHDVRSLAVADDGTIYVGNNQTKTVRVFAPDGRFQHEFGGSGQGPGEYLAVNRVWLTQGGVAITDWQRGGRTGVYDRSGNLLYFWQALQPDGSTLIPWGHTPDGWLAYRSASDPPPSGLPEGTPIEMRNPLRRFDPDSNTLGDTVLEPPPFKLYVTAHGGRDWALFRPRADLGLDAAGNLFMSWGDPYRIDVYDAAGRHVRGISRDVELMPITDADMEQLKEQISDFYDGRRPVPGYDPSSERERTLAQLDRQRAYDPRPHLPPTGRLLVSRDGSFWIERVDKVEPAALEMERIYGRSGGVRRPSHWDLFDSEGRFLTSVAIDARFQPHAVRGAEVTGVLRDDLDIEYVVTYRAVSVS